MKRSLLFIITLLTILFIPDASSAQIVLGPAASKFVLYSSLGAITDNASAHSHLTGDVGTSTTGPITGFGNVDGVMHPGADIATAACNVDLLATIAQLNLVPATSFPSATMGSGTIYTPGVYAIPGNATLTLDLILDGQNDPNAEFIFKIGGTFGTNTNSKVRLINGALACHVYWQVTGAVTMASLSTMRGNIISGGAINMGSSDSLEGRAFTTTGLIGIDGITAFTPIGCNSVMLTGPKLPNLASVGCYTIFSANGALANTLGTTTVVGDVGKNNNGSSITGWSTGDVTGTLHSVQDPSTILAAADLSKLYDTLNAMVPDIELLYPAQFGNNLVLTPHVYVMNGATTFTDSLYLNAQGNPDAVFVIKIIGGALTTSTYSKVKLMNGAQSRNIFWLVQGAVSINNYSVFRGTIVIPVGTLNFVNIGIVLDGRALTLNGAITTHGLTATNPPSSFIAMEPINKTACAGTAAMFIVKAAGSGLSYRWRKGTTTLLNAGNISGADNDTLVINPVTLSDTASNYNVIVSGMCSPNDTSINVSLKLNDSITIVTQPSVETACVGDTAMFIIAATGAGLTYRWRKGTIDLFNLGNISGVDNDTLIIYPATIADTSSNYNVIISSTCSPNDTSINIQLNVTPLPIAVASSNSPVCTGNALNLFSQTVAGAIYNWTGPNAYSASIQNPVILSATTARSGSYSLIVTVGSCNSLPSVVAVVISDCDSADLSIVKTVNNSRPVIGNPVVFTIVATNNGPSLTTSIKVADILQSGYSYVSSSTTKGAYNSSTGVWLIDTLNNGATATLTLIAVVNAVGNYVNTATIEGFGFDKDLANNISSVETFPSDFFIPQGFSPNGDGTNDLFVIRGIGQYPANTFTIFNRWGNKVFDASPYKNEWNGRSTSGIRVGGDELPVGTYFYMLNLGDGSNVIKGTIYLNK